MIDNSSASISSNTAPVQADNKAVQRENISQAVTAENVQAEKVVNQTKEAERVKPQSNSEPSSVISPELSHDKVEEAVASLNAFVQLMDRNVSFEIDTHSGRDVISVFEKETKELIRQIPSEETLELLKRMDTMVGVLFSENV
jgi:flagellar protein FlaG